MFAYMKSSCSDTESIEDNSHWTSGKNIQEFKMKIIRKKCTTTLIILVNMTFHHAVIRVDNKIRLLRSEPLVLVKIFHRETQTCRESQTQQEVEYGEQQSACLKRNESHVNTDWLCFGTQYQKRDG
jgi:hypothetical protein